MSSRFKLIRGVAMNWVAMATGILVGFFLSPFVVHHLGNVAYGVWTIIVSLASYMGLLDLGIRGAAMRFVARDHARGDHDKANEAVAAALFLRSGMVLVILSVSVLASFLAPRLFHVPSHLVSAARICILVTGVNLSISLTLGVYGGVLAALHRFDLMSSVTIGQTVFRALGAVWLLEHGYGIVALAIWELTSVTVGNTVLTLITLRVYPQLRFRFQKPNFAIVKEFWFYSSWVLVINFGQQLIYYTDNLVVAGFISAAAVTFYAIGGSLIEYLRGVIASLTATFTPLASSLEAVGDKRKMRELMVQGTRASFFVGLAFQVALYFRGETFIGLWMGREYAPVSGPILRVLLIASFVMNANLAGIGILYGISKHKINAWWTAGEAIANLVLSIVLVRHMGLVGVAWGTVIPGVFVSLFLRPGYTCRLIEMPLQSFVWQGCLRPILAAVPFGIACYWTNLHWNPTNLMTFFLQIAAVLPIYLVGFFAAFWNESWRILRMLREKFANRAVAVEAN